MKERTITYIFVAGALAVVAAIMLVPMPKYAPPASEAGVAAAPIRAMGAVPNLTGMNPLCSTSSSLASGLVCKTDAGAHVRACHFRNNSDAGAWFELADLTTIPTSYAANTDSDAGPGMVGDPFYVAPGADAVLGTEFFGVDGWLTGTGFSVGVSSTAPGDASTFTAAGSLFQITCNGQ
jgi:hypothetical protein